MICFWRSSLGRFVAAAATLSLFWAAAMPKQDIAVELYYDSGWHDLVANDDVLADAPIVITRGDGDESAAPRPASVSLRLANDDDLYRTSNPMSPLYGKAGVNTPLRVSVGGVVRGYALASSWQAAQDANFRQSPRRGRAWVDVQGGGLLQRVNQWTENLRSPFRQYNNTIATSIGYWPGEQERGSTTVVSDVPGVSAPVFQTIAPDSQYRPPSSGPLLDMGDNAEIGAYFVQNGTAASTSGWQMSFAYRLAPLVAGEQDIFDWAASDGTQYGLYLNPTTGKMLIYSSRNGVAVLTGAATSYSGYDWSQWTMFTIDAQYSAGTTTIWVNWVNANGSTSGFMNASFVGVPSSLLWWNASNFAGVPSGSTIGHVIGVPTSSVAGAYNLFGLARQSAWFGYVGETAADRFARLCTQLGLSYHIYGTPALSSPMGAQPVDTFAKQLEEIEATEDGRIFDATDAAQIVFRLRNQRVNQTVALSLNADDETGFTSLPREVTDDLPIHNVVTASQRDGADYTVTDSTSPMGTQDPPNGRGVYKQTVNVNLADPGNELPQQANWWLRRGTVNLPRFPQVTVNLAALDAASITAVERVDVGSVIEIVNFREYTLRLSVIGYTETIGTHSRAITFTCAPDQQFRSGVYDGSASYVPRYDLRSCTLSAAVGPNTTTIALAIVNDETWSTTSAYDLLISGELVGVPAGGMSARSGSAGAYAQTITGAVRSKNGIRKTLPAASEVHVATPGRWALS